MIVIYLLIPLSIVTATIFLIGFFWAVKSGQYEDTCTPALRLLSDDAAAAKTAKLAEAPETNPSQPGVEAGQNLTRDWQLKWSGNADKNGK